MFGFYIQLKDSQFYIYIYILYLEESTNGLFSYLYETGSILIAMTITCRILCMPLPYENVS